MEAGIKVFSRGREWVGRTTGTERHCPMECCGGRRIGVRWHRKTPSGRNRITWPCTGGMDFKIEGLMEWSAPPL